MNTSESNMGAADCPSCRAPAVGGLDGCRALFSALGEKEFSNPDYYRVHRLTVDAYCLQHPEQHMVSSKSAAAHLAAMCWSMEIGASVNMPAPLKLWLDGPRKYVRVPPPPLRQRGEVTVVDMVDAESLEDYETSAKEWAASAWGAWSDHWDQARAWVQESIGEYETGSGRPR